MIDTIVGGIRDCIFFLVVAYLGLHHAIGEPILAALLSAYTAHRFGISMGKQSAVIALNNGPGTGTGGTGGGASGTSGTMRAVPDPNATTRRIDPRTLAPDSEAVTPSGGMHLDTGTLDTGAYQAIAGTVGGIE